MAEVVNEGVERYLSQLKKRAPASLDFDALGARHQAFNDRLAAEWAERYPGSDAAVLELAIPVSGHLKRRLRRYREISGALMNTPGCLIFRESHSFRHLTMRTMEIAVGAARAGVDVQEWRLITAGEAVTAAP